MSERERERQLREVFGAIERQHDRCQACGVHRHRVARLEVHHVLPKSWIKANARLLGLDDPGALLLAVWDPRNAMVLCAGPQRCHDRHTGKFETIRRQAIPPAALAFAEALGDPAVAKLEREYPDPPLTR